LVNIPKEDTVGSGTAWFRATKEQVLPVLQTASAPKSEKAPPWPNHWSNGTGVLLGLALGFFAQRLLHANDQIYAEMVGLPTWAVHWAHLLGPLFVLGLPFSFLMRIQFLPLQALCAVAMGISVFGYFWAALPIFLFFLSLGPNS
jgi:hypothetical protein